MKEPNSPNCPHCGFKGSNVNRRDTWEDTVRCYRTCKSCGRPYTTIEVPVVFEGNTYVPYKQADKRPLPSAAIFRRPVMPADTWGLPYQLAMDVCHWWEVARWSKWGRKAVWTERAFKASLNRVLQLHAVTPDRARELVQAGVEKGWQSLDPKFLNPDRPIGRPFASTAPAQASPMGPVSPTMQSALESWNDSP